MIPQYWAKPQVQRNTDWSGWQNQGLFENTGDKYNVLNYHSGTNWKNQDGTDLVTVKSYIIKCRKVNLSGM